MKNKKILIFIKKFLSFIIITIIITNFFIISVKGSDWTYEKAKHLAKRALIGVDKDTINTLYQAGSAVNAVNILFPSKIGPDRTNFLNGLEDFKGPTFNPNDTSQNRRVYQYMYYADPYEAKRKLFSLFEDIFAVDRTGNSSDSITFEDVNNHFDILFNESLGNYKNMVKRVLFDTQKAENSFVMGKYLDLLNQTNKDYPNENYARELMQLFLMGEYKPWEDAETIDAIRNYTEEDVAALALILTGFRSGDDKKVYFDYNYHNTNTSIYFLSGSLKTGDSFSFYNSGSGIIDNTLIVESIGGNNGLGDNIIDYIFSKRESEIAYFLSWRILKHYLTDKPKKEDIIILGNKIIENNFELYPTIKWFLVNDMFYNEEYISELRYKNPIELTIGTLKLLHSDNSFVISEHLKDASMMSNFDFVPYNPGSIFGRDGFDNNGVFMNAYFHNIWTTFTSNLAFKTGTGYYNLEYFIPIKEPAYTEDEIIDLLEDKLYLGQKLPNDVREKLKIFLVTNHDGSSIDFKPNDITYRNKYLRGLISIMLSQVEFLLLSGHGKEEIINTNSGSLINDSSKKLILVELFGGYDWLDGIIPKDEYDYYKEIRGSIAYEKEDLIDLGNFYLSKSFSSFIPFYNSGELKIINRVGAPNHSRRHDAARIQISSQKAIQTVGTPGIIGELIKNEQNPLNHIVLGTNKPSIYINGRYINIGGNSILYKNNISGTTNDEKNYQLSILKDILKTRDYPGDTRINFVNSTKLDDVGKLGQESVGYDLSSRLNFTKNFILNSIGTTYYIPGGGGYDTHANQLASNYNLQNRTFDLTNDISNFFQELKNLNIDATIVIYSEFGRTLKENGTKGTDHGQGGGYFILTTNNELKQKFPTNIIGKISLKKEYNNWLGVGIDYRSIFSAILKSLYNIDVKKYFDGDYSLENDLDSIAPKLAFKRFEYANFWWDNINARLNFKIEDKNFRFRDGSYINFYYGQDENNLTPFSKWIMRRDVYDLKTDSYSISLNLPQTETYHYRLELVDNQYNTLIYTGSFVLPFKNISNNNISLQNDTFFGNYNNTILDGELILPNKITLINNLVEEIKNGSGETIAFSGSEKQLDFDGIKMFFGTGETLVEKLTGKNLVWNGGFLLPRFIDKNTLLSDESSFSGKLLKNLDIKSIFKVGADSLGVGMELNQKVGFEISLGQTNSNYKVITSEDLINWKQVDDIQILQNSIKFYTKYFSYFAIYDDTQAIVPTNPETSIIIPEKTVISSSGGGGGGGSGLVRDKCPNGDKSPSYYDRTCEANPNKVLEGNRMGNNDEELTVSKTIRKGQKEDIKQIKDIIYKGYIIPQFEGYSKNKQIELIFKIIIDSKQVKDKILLLTRLRDFLKARIDYIKNKKDKRLKNLYTKHFILVKDAIKKTLK